MRLITIVFFVLFLISEGFSQNLDKILLSRPHENGTLYHLMQTELKSCKKSSLSADFTFVSSPKSDSIRLLILFEHTQWKGKPTSIQLHFDPAKEISFNVDEINILYVKKKKKNWITRAEVYLTESDFKTLLKSGTYSINWITNEGSCAGEQPKKYIPLFQEFGTLLEYN